MFLFAFAGGHAAILSCHPWASSQAKARGRQHLGASGSIWEQPHVCKEKLEPAESLRLAGQRHVSCTLTTARLGAGYEPFHAVSFREPKPCCTSRAEPSRASVIIDTPTNPARETEVSTTSMPHLHQLPHASVHLTDLFLTLCRRRPPRASPCPSFCCLRSTLEARGSPRPHLPCRRAPGALRVARSCFPPSSSRHPPSTSYLMKMRQHLHARDCPGRPGPHALASLRGLELRSE